MISHLLQRCLAVVRNEERGEVDQNDAVCLVSLAAPNGALSEAESLRSSRMSSGTLRETLWTARADEWDQMTGA